MAWRGGFSGVGYTRSEFTKWLASQPKPSFVKFIVLHNSGAPTMKQARATTFSQRVRNFGHDYKNIRKWSSGPHLFVFEDGHIYTGSPLATHGTHSPSWNGQSWGLEMVADFRTGSDDPTKGGGLVIYDTAAWVFAQLLTHLGLAPTGDTIKLHREDKKTTHACPGDRITKADFVSRVKTYMWATPGAVSLPSAEVVVPAKSAIGTLNEVQTLLVKHGFNPGPVDGLLGPKTKAGVVAFQKALGLSGDGKVGPYTWARLVGPVAVQPPVASVPALKPDVPVSPPPVKPVAPIMAPGAAEKNPVKLMRILTGPQVLWPRHWAQGAGGQAQQESFPDLRPWAEGDWMINDKPVKKGTPGAKPTAHTIWQLRNDRWAAYQTFAMERKALWDDFETQVLWCPHELKTSEKLAWKWLQQAKDVEQACAAMVWYERPKGYISKHAKVAETWAGVFAVSEKCDAWTKRLAFAKAL